MEDKNLDLSPKLLHRSLREQVWQPSCKFDWTLGNFFCSLSGNERNVSFFSTTNSNELFIVSDTWNSTSKPCSKYFCQTASIFLLKVQKWWKKHSFSKKTPQNLLGTRQAESIFDNPGEFICEKAENLLAHFPNFFPGLSERTSFSPKDYFWRKDTLSKSLLKKSHKKVNFHRQLKNLLQTNFLIKTLPQNFPLERQTAVLTNLPENSAKRRIYYLSILLKGKNSLFGGKLSLEVPLETSKTFLSKMRQT